MPKLIIKNSKLILDKDDFSKYLENLNAKKPQRIKSKINRAHVIKLNFNEIKKAANTLNTIYSFSSNLCNLQLLAEIAANQKKLPINFK